MKASYSLLIPVLLFLSSLLFADSPLIRTTVADNSRVVFIAQTPLSWEIVDNHNLDFIRFTDSPVMDSTGYPELPVITVMVAVPDSATPIIDFDLTGLGYEMECMAWDEDGLAANGWPTDEYSGAVYSSAISPTSLGKLNNTTYADVLFSTAGIVYAFNSSGDPLNTLDFPVTLPEGVNAPGGFAIGDIDRDGKVEIVFGTTDGYLHCWELGTCSTGYAPWTQFKHDNRRSGVFE